MLVSDEEMRVAATLIENMTSYDTGRFGLGHSDKVVLQLMYNRFAEHTSALKLHIVEEDITDELE